MRSLIKQILNYLALLLVGPLIILSKTGLVIGRERPYLGCAQALAGVPGLVGVVLRRAFYRFVLDSFAWDVVIEYGTFFSHPQAEVDGEVAVGAYCVLGRCRIGAGTVVASHVSILSGRRQHGIADREAEAYRQVSIGADCWLGERSVIMADVGPGSTIGAGAVVVKNIPAGAVAVGNPAAPLEKSPQ